MATACCACGRKHSTHPFASQSVTRSAEVSTEAHNCCLDPCVTLVCVCRIDDWNYIDYVRVFGSLTLSTAALRSGQHQVVYVPNEHAHGEDSFEFRASECVPRLRARSTLAADRAPRLRHSLRSVLMKRRRLSHCH
jgi:hypothetical protein